MRIIEELKRKVTEAYQQAQEAQAAGNAMAKERWLAEYQRLYRTLKIQEAILLG